MTLTLDRLTCRPKCEIQINSTITEQNEWWNTIHWTQHIVKLSDTFIDKGLVCSRTQKRCNAAVTQTLTVGRETRDIEWWWGSASVAFAGCRVIPWRGGANRGRPSASSHLLLISWTAQPKLKLQLLFVWLKMIFM